jgi:hypothetical protein
MKHFIRNNMHRISASNCLILIDNKTIRRFIISNEHYFSLTYYLNYDLFVIKCERFNSVGGIRQLYEPSLLG